jgi:peroxiredoxin
MKYFFSILTFIFISLSCLAQSHCFAECWDNFEKSDLPVGEKNRQILHDLVGCNAPDFEVKTIEGKQFKLSDLKGKVVVLNFWFQACPPCIAEIPALNKLREEYESADVVFIALGRDSAPSIINFLNNNAFAYHQVSGDYKLDRDYCILAGYPTNLVIDKNGIVRQIFSGGAIDSKADTEAYNKMKPTIDKYLMM